MRFLDWKIGGIFLGVVFFIAILLVKPIGVSTEFSVAGGLIQSVFDNKLIYEDSQNTSGYGSNNRYFNKSGGEIASEIAEPINYSNVFVLFIILGGFISAATNKAAAPTSEEKISPNLFRERISEKPGARYLTAFIAGVISLFGARMAGGCTSGHMMRGIMQTAISGMVFAAAVFASAITTSLIMYKKEKGE